MQREKAEQELFISVKKATNPDETAPKQKHVRVITLFTWDFAAARPFWDALKMQAVLSDDVQCFKALITIHKVMRDGHPCALEETMREVVYLDTVMRNAQQNVYIMGYGSLIQAYIQFIKAKLEFHTFHPEFTANLSYEEYRALRKVEEPNEGYNTISELMTLQDKLDRLHKTVFSSFRAGINNECRISALVPLVEESYGIYSFITSMLHAMHATVESHAALEPLRNRYNAQYKTLRQFYYECSNIRYLTSLITIPRLPENPPDFVREPAANRKPIAEPPREKTPPPEDLWGSVTSVVPEPAFGPLISTSNSSAHNLVNFAENNQQMVMMRQEQQIIHNQNMAIEGELNLLRQQNIQAQQLLAAYEGKTIELERTCRAYEQRINHYEQQLVSMNNMDMDKLRQDQDKDALIKSLQEQVALWRNKYENISTMYAALRKEHLDFLAKTKEIQKLANSTKEILGEKEKLAAQLKGKISDYESLTREMDKWKNQYATLKESSDSQIMQLSRELNEHKSHVVELSHSKGQDIENLVQKFNLEKAATEALLLSRQQELEKANAQLRDVASEIERFKAEHLNKSNEIKSLQDAVDQTMAALKQLQQKGSDREADLLGRMDSLNIDHRSQMDKIMDSVLEDCKGKAGDAVFHIDSDAHPGNQTATPELVLSTIEKLTTSSSEFALVFVKHLTSGDTSGNQQAEAIKHANNLVQVVASLLHNAKGITRLSGNEEVTERVLVNVRKIGNLAKNVFHKLQSPQLANIEFSQRSQKVQQYHDELVAACPDVVKITESLVPKDVAAITLNDNLDQILEDEMKAASNAIEDAAKLLASLLNEDRSLDPKLTSIDIQVHKSILSAVKAITEAIGKLIISATHAQQEIVSHGKGAGTASAFYKKNSRWLEGLISAAKTVALATKTLVETANGVVHGTFKMEQLIVAAHEVAAATAQLVSASRVKAVRGSKTQDKLESSAKAVTDATKLLVKTVDELRKREAKTKGDVDFTKLSAHDFKKKEMEQQVKILTFEKNLSDARMQLSEMRRQAYHSESEVVNE